ncbi:hypothetical protein C8R48DRAFT_778382 [Suillus tomentosus]|nr:hypothetical protein C8R48DRAFT_778382 [Suillus tomentosus]
MDDAGYNSDASIVVSSTNIFDNIPALAHHTDVEHVDNALAWWNECRTLYPRLSRMALITSQFQTTRAILCLGYWSQLGLVKTEDVQSVAALADVQGDGMLMEDGWDAIVL